MNKWKVSDKKNEGRQGWCKKQVGLQLYIET